MQIGKSVAKILTIDDDERNRMLFEAFVKASGHDIVFATGGKMGIEVASLEVPDLILLDLMMPGMDGFQVIRALKSTPITQNIPIIVVSSLDDVASQKRMLGAGVSEFIVKPVDRWELSRRISKLLASSVDQNRKDGSGDEDDNSGNG